ncbi:glycosyltransferase family 4 protein [Paenibacillus sp. 1P07SE]|uniref:glycosyltransferase family 4 protein n=1 Tax=Paenibacillus sp. 1P07SE TaxID=3132209 RepID=UPI0039A71516
MKILLVPDHPGWAFDNRANDLLSLRWNGLRFTKKYQSEVRAKDQKRYDLIYPMSLSVARRLHSAGIPMNKMATGITSLRVFENQFATNGEFKPKFLSFVKQLRGINAWSDEIVTIFKPHCKIYKTRIGIREDQFKPMASKKNRDIFTVGWVGRIDDPKSRELKGYDIVLEALRGLEVKLDIRTFKENYVPRSQMVHFYQNLDCFICSSRSEGLPNPLLEAAACGVPVIATKVGIVPELIRQGKNGLIVSRNATSIRKQVRYLMKHAERRQALGREIRKTIVRDWTWNVCKAEWEAFFKSLL